MTAVSDDITATRSEAPKRGAELRRGGRIVDVRLRLSSPPDVEVLRAIESKLRETDAVFSYEGFEIELALAGTSADDTFAFVLPRIREALRGLNLTVSFAVDGEPAPD